MSLVVGLTGGIATGKSTIAQMFKDWSVPVIDADQIAREVVLPGEVALEKIAEHFGNGVLLEDGTLNRKALGAIIFNDSAKRNELNAIIHPEIRKKMHAQRDAYIEAKETLIVMDIPLLFESKRFNDVDKVLVVYIPEELQKKRLIERDQISEDEAMSRIRSQLPIEEKRTQADAIIDNSGTKEDSRRQLVEVLRSWGVEEVVK